MVYEAYRNVEATPLGEFIFRGRRQGFAVYRLKEEDQQHIPALIKNVQAYLGRPYDARYQMDDEKIYCTELIYKAYRDATGGEELGQLVRLGDLSWQPFARTIEHFEGGDVPLDREILLPKEMIQAEQLESVRCFNLVVPQ